MSALLTIQTMNLSSVQLGVKLSVDPKCLDCAICFDVMSFEYSTLVCGHSYCTTCISESLRHSGSCPVCRGEAMFDLRDEMLGVLLNRVERKMRCGAMLSGKTCGELHEKSCLKCLDVRIGDLSKLRRSALTSLNDIITSIDEFEDEYENPRRVRRRLEFE